MDSHGPRNDIIGRKGSSLRLKTGHPFYGQHVGVLVFSTVTPRAPGDAGNAASFSYPVRYEVVQGGFADLIEGGPEIKANLLQAGQELVRAGVRAIVGDCGMMSLYQDCLGAELGVLFAGSSLCQIPLIWELLGRQGRIGIITGHSELLRETHLRSSGWRDDIRLSIQGMQDEPHFNEIVIRGGLSMDIDRMRADVLNAGRKLREKTPDLRAVIFECSNLATYSADLAEALDVPVFDTISAANMLAYAVQPPRYL